MLGGVMAYKRKTVDVWKLFVDYGDGWEHETTEVTFEAMKENRKAYRENCSYPQRWKRGREPITPEILADIAADKALRNSRK